MLETFSRNGELGHWPKPNRQDPQLQKLYRRHRQIATRILSLTSAIEHGPSTLEYQIICREMRSLCRRLLGLEKEYWQRSGNSGLPPTLQSIHGSNFATNATLRDVLDEAFLTREELGVQPFHHIEAMPSSVTEATEKPAADVTPPVGPTPERKPRQNLQRNKRLQKLLEHHGREAQINTDPVATSDMLWDNGTDAKRSYTPHDHAWHIVPMRERIPEYECPMAIRVSQVLRRYGENDHA